MPIELPDIHFIDFEGSTRTGIVEYGLVTLSHGSIRASSTALCAPRAPMHIREIEVHGITNDAVKTCPPFETHWEYFRDQRRSGLFAAHNAVVEHTLINQIWPHGGIFPGFGSQPDSSGWGPWIDTRWLVPNLFRDVGSCSLMELIEQFELLPMLHAEATRICPPDRATAHCALYDALASALLFQHIASIPNFNTLSLSDWLLFSTQPQAHTQLDLF